MVVRWLFRQTFLHADAELQHVCAPVDLNAPSLAAILKDVGLRLESRKQLMDVYVVEHVEKPSGN